MPKILYHVTFLPPQMPERVAELQEINALCSRFEGEIVYLNPNYHSPVYVPRLLFGLFCIKALRQKEARFDLHHLYNPDAFAFPMLRFLKRPVVYTISGGVSNRRPNVSFFNAMAATAVPDGRSAERLRAWGIEKVFQVNAGIDISRFTCSPLSIRSDVRLLVGSAPWTQKQFRTKGVDTLLSAAQQFPHLQLIFLWRGVLTEEMERRVRRMNLGKRVKVLNEHVDVNRVLAGVHASVALATEAAIIKSYPHSLMESLAAGKPVLISRSIPMADYVERMGCGKVVENVSATELLSAVEALIHEYDELQTSARFVGQRDFSQEQMVNSFQMVYEHVLGRRQENIVR